MIKILPFLELYLWKTTTKARKLKLNAYSKVKSNIGKFTFFLRSVLKIAYLWSNLNLSILRTPTGLYKSSSPLHQNWLLNDTLFVLVHLFIVLNLFIYFNWSLITLQYCGCFCHTLTWICRRYILICPSWDSLKIIQKN